MITANAFLENLPPFLAKECENEWRDFIAYAQKQNELEGKGPTSYEDHEKCFFVVGFAACCKCIGEHRIKMVKP